MDLDDDELKATRKAKGLERTADEMFEAIEFKKILDNDKEILYQCKTKAMEESFEFNTLFAKVSKLIRNDHLLNMQELQAIYKKCEELGWI